MTAIETSAPEARSGGGRTLPGAAVILGARNLGGAIARDLLDLDVAVASVARTRGDLEVLAGEGAVPLAADAADPEQLRTTFERAAEALGSLELIVNAVSATRPPQDVSGFGGGTIRQASTAGLEGWLELPVRQAFVFLRESARALAGAEGTIIQVLGAPARRPAPERGLVAGAQAAIRAMTTSAALELREYGIHVALVIVDGPIESPKTERMTRGMPAEALVQMADVSGAIGYLATQSARGWSHELVITPEGGRYVP